jgi:hypothetical protein
MDRQGGRHRIELREGIFMDQCPRCGEDVLHVPLHSNSEIMLRLSAEPDELRGKVLVIGNQAKFINGPEEYALCRKNKFPLYARHNVVCRNIYPRHESLDE